MPLRAVTNTNRRNVPATGATHPRTNVVRGHGHRSIMYRDTNGKSWEAIIIGPGSASGLLLEIPALRMKGVSVWRKDNVAPATTVKSTNAYFDRWPAPNPTISA